jgi:hypothetical protein
MDINKLLASSSPDFPIKQFKVLGNPILVNK